MKSMPIGLVGRGRVARHLCHWFALEGIAWVQWHRGSPDTLEYTLEECRTILLAISDDSIEALADAHPQLADRNTLHLSGSRTIPGIPGFHPLISFGPDLYGLDVYRSIPFITEAGGPTFPEVFPGLPNPHRELDAEKKALYHALCVMSGNFSTILWNRAFQGFEENLGLPREILLPYLKQIAVNLETNPDQALTGPLARGDVGTMKANLNALGNDPLSNIYKAFTTLFNFDLSSPDTREEANS